MQTDPHNSSDSELEQFKHRLLSVERQNRNLKRAFLAVTVIALTPWLIAANQQHGVVDAVGFRVIDRDGVPRITIGTNPGTGEAAIYVYDARGAAVTRYGAVHEPFLEMGAPDASRPLRRQSVRLVNLRRGEGYELSSTRGLERVVVARD